MDQWRAVITLRDLWKKGKYLERLLASEKYCAMCSWPETP
jgi:hypothetical protein